MRNEALPTERLISAAQNHGGHLGREAIESLMAEAWEEGAKAGWSQTSEGWNAEWPDEDADEWSVSLAGNPYLTNRGSDE